MSNQDFGRGATARSSLSEGTARTMKDAASEAASKVSDVARDAGSKAKQAASETATTMTNQVKELLDKQIGSSASAAGQLGGAIKLAADDLDSQSPMLAGFVRTFGGQVETYADDLQNQTIDQLARKASDLTQKQPALVFGLAALAGFFLFRTVKSSSTDAAPPIQPSQYGHRESTHG